MLGKNHVKSQRGSRSWSSLLYKIIFATLALNILLYSTAIFIYFNPLTRNSIKVLLVAPEFIQKHHYAGWQKILKIRPLLKLTPEPITQTVTIPASDGQLITADLWLPNSNTNRQYPAVITTVGVEVSKDDVRNTFLATNLARLGFAVLVPELPGQMAGRFDANDANYLVDSFNYLQSLPVIKKEKTGFLAYCGSSVIALIAAANPKINKKVTYVVVNNLFYNTFSLYKAIVARKLTDKNGKIVDWAANPKTVQVFNRNFIDLLPHTTDKQILHRYLANQPEDILFSRYFPPIPDNLWQQLSDDAKRLYYFLANHDPDQIERLIAELPDFAKYNNDHVSTAADKVANLKAKLFVIADHGNTFQPFTESYKFLSLLPKSQYYFLETSLLKDSFLIQDLSFQKAVTEGVKIVIFATLLLTQAS